jgi:hypothetical protein
LFSATMRFSFDPAEFLTDIDTDAITRGRPVVHADLLALHGHT